MDDALRQWVEATTGATLTASRRHLVGGSRDLWFIEVDGHPLVLRAETGAGALADTPLTLQREARVSRALAGSGVPVAEIVAVSEQPNAVLMARLPGTSDLRRLGPGNGPALVEHFMAILAALHRIDAASLDLPGLRATLPLADHVLHEIELWHRIVERHLPTPDPLIGAAMRWLEDKVPTRSVPVALVQGDTGPGNFLFMGAKVTGLVDWELSHLGDPMEDLAWLDLRAQAEPFADAGARHAAYERAGGTALDGEALAYYRVFVNLRCAVITGIAIARGGTHGIDAYRAPHRRFLGALGGALADAAVAGLRTHPRS